MSMISAFRRPATLAWALAGLLTVPWVPARADVKVPAIFGAHGTAARSEGSRLGLGRAG